MLSAAQNAKRSPEGDLSLQIALVAGACNRRALQLWSRSHHDGTRESTTSSARGCRFGVQ
jgi:hypothetical protein